MDHIICQYHIICIISYAAYNMLILYELCILIFVKDCLYVNLFKARVLTLCLIRYRFIGQHAISHFYLFFYSAMSSVNLLLGVFWQADGLLWILKNHFRKSVSSFLTEIRYFENFSICNSITFPVKCWAILCYLYWQGGKLHHCGLIKAGHRPGTFRSVEKWLNQS